MNPELSQLLERFRRGPELVATVLTGVYGEEIDWPPSAEAWSIRQIAAHLADAEMVGAYRIRVVAAEENPTMLAYNEKAWAENLDYARRKPSQSLESFRRTRAETFELLQGLPEAAFARAGNHTEHGRITLLDLLRIYAEHAEGHARQIQSVRDAYKRRAMAAG
jgi:hypothetical protein